MKRFGQSLDPDKVVRNYSKRCLSSEEKQVFALGLNFAVTPRTIPTETIVAVDFLLILTHFWHIHGTIP